MRYQTQLASPSGQFPGVFAAVNGLAGEEQLSRAEQEWRRINNAWFETHLIDPGNVDDAVFDRTINEHTSSWFRSDADEFVQRTFGYLDILDTHGVDWIELRSTDPGSILYCDDQQIVIAACHDPQQLDHRIVARSADLVRATSVRVCHHDRD